MSLFKPTGEILARKLWPGGTSYYQHMDEAHTHDWGDWEPCECPTTVEVEWKGGRVLEISGQLVEAAREGSQGHVRAVGRHGIDFGGVRLLVIGGPVWRDGYYRDTYLAMKDGPLAVCAKMYWEAAHWVLSKFVRVEAWLRRSKGEGEFMPAAAWLAKRLL